MSKNVIILNNKSSALTDYLLKYFQPRGINIRIVDNIDDNFALNTDLIILIEQTDRIYIPQGKKVINIHPSLLPAFMGENAIQNAFISGVKVSGVTVHYVEEGGFYGRIIAQYPVLIGLSTHLDEFKSDILDVEKKIYPAVIDSILEDRVFDFHDLFRGGCHHAGGCSGNCCNK